MPSEVALGEAGTNRGSRSSHPLVAIRIAREAASARRGASGAVCRHSVALVLPRRRLAKVPPPVAALEWVKANRPDAVLYSDSLLRHADFYWREGETRSEPKSEADCEQFRKVIKTRRRVLSTSPKLRGTSGTQVASFKRDARIHDKHHLEFIFEFGKSDKAPG
jgi:hypothetical protein